MVNLAGAAPTGFALNPEVFEVGSSCSDQGSYSQSLGVNVNEGKIQGSWAVPLPSCRSH